MKPQATPLSILKERALAAARPLYASMELTYACNMHCGFCYNPVHRMGQSRRAPAPSITAPALTFEEILKLLDDFRELGALYFTVTGGEALLHPQFWKILEAAKSRAFAIRVFSNGLAIDRSAADRFAQLKPYCLEISIHGASDASVEALTGVPHGFHRVLQTLQLLRERALRVYLKCVVTRLNEHELDDINAIGERFGFPVYFDPVLTISDDGDDYPLHFQASDDAIRKLYRSDGINIGNSPFERTAGELNCTVAMGTVHVDPYGNVQPCVQWKEKAGNIRRQSLREIWLNSRVMEEARRINRETPAVIPSLTEFHKTCQHCPGLSMLRYGDGFRLEEQYLRVARIRQEVMETTRSTSDQTGHET